MENVSGSLGKYLKMVLHIRQQKREIATLVIMRHSPSRDLSEPLNAIGIGIISRSINQKEVLLQFSEHTAHEQGTSRGVRLEIVSNHDGDMPTTFGASNSGAHLFTEHISGTSWSRSAIEPAISPVHQAEPIDLAVVSRSLDQALPTPARCRLQTRVRVG